MAIENSVYNEDKVQEIMGKLEGFYQPDSVGYHFTFKDFVDCLKAHAAVFDKISTELDNTDNIESYHSQWQNKFNKGLIAYLISDSKRGMFKELEHSISHDTPFITSWNGLVNKNYINLTQEEQIEKLRPITHLFEQIPHLIFLPLEKGGLNNLEAEKVLETYVRFISKIEAGNFPAQYLSTYDYGKCSGCGKNFHVELGLWNGRLQVANPDKKNVNTPFFSPEYCGNDKIESVTVNFPSGKLYVNDWVRIKEFTDLVIYRGEDEYKENANINYTVGRIFHIKYYAEKFNFISVNVGNSSPRVFADNNNLVIGCHSEEDESLNSNFEKKGTVCTDLWNATIIDKETLYKLLEPNLKEKTQAAIDDWVNDSETFEIEVEPGEYTLHFHGNYYDFEKTAKKQSSKLSEEQKKLLPDDIEKFFIVNPKGSLELSNNVKKNKKKF